MFLGGDFRSLNLSPLFLGGVIIIGSINIDTLRLAAFVVAITIGLALVVLLERTLLGKAMRATAIDSGAAELMGIPVQRVYLLTMGTGAALAGFAGAMLMPIYSVYPAVGFQILLMGFVVVILGGLGSVQGALLGGLVVGVVEALSGYLAGTALSQVCVFVVFLAVLLIRPQGLLRGDLS